MGCNQYYTNDDFGKLRTRLLKSLASNNIDDFINYIESSWQNIRQFRLVPNQSDSEQNVIDSTNLLDSAIQNIIDGYVRRLPALKVRGTEFLQRIRQTLYTEGMTQSEAESPDIESKTESEILDKKETKLKTYLEEFYGLDGNDLITNLKRSFNDMMFGIMAYDANSNVIGERNDAVLNMNINAKKNQLFKRVVKYLKQQFPNSKAIQELSENRYNGQVFGFTNYNKAMSLFYRSVASTEDFQSKLETANIERIKGTDRQGRIAKYQELMNLLFQNSKFQTEFQNKYASIRKDVAKNALYAADHYSAYYDMARRFIMDPTNNVGHLQSYIDQIEAPKIDILDASNAYVMLRRFDHLLKDAEGNQIAIKKGTENVDADIADKYSYQQDTTHQRKGFSTSNETDSTVYTAQFTKSFLDTLRLYDYKTGDFMNRRANSTMFIVAAHNFIDAIINNRASFAHVSEEVTAERNSGERRNLTETRARELRHDLITFHSDPVGKLQHILELLFENVPRMNRSLADVLNTNRNLTDQDINVLYSLYNMAFNKNLGHTFYAQSMNNTASFNTMAQALLEDLAGYIDRNVTASYLETDYDAEDGAARIQSKKKYFNNLSLYRIMNRINTQANASTTDPRRTLAQKYPFSMGLEPSDNGDLKQTFYSVKFGDNSANSNMPKTEFRILINNGNFGQIMGNNVNGVAHMKFEVTGKPNFFSTAERLASDAVNNIDLIKFRDKILNNSVLTEDEALLKNMLQFIDDNLNLGIINNPSVGLRTLATYSSIYEPVDNMNHWLMPLLKLAMRSAYVNSMYLGATDSGARTLKEYLVKTKNSIYDFYATNENSKLFSKPFNNLKYTVASFNDEALSIWADAKSIMDGDASKATTKDKQGNSIPNNSVNKLGTNLRYYLDKQFNTNTETLMFASRPDMIVNTYHDLEVTNMQNKTKSIRAFTPGELFYHAIFNKFWGSYLKYGTVIVQPTTYSDKTTFLNYEIKPVWTRESNKTVDLMTASKSDIIEVYSNTIGSLYNTIYAETTEKLTQIARAWATEHQINTNQDYRDIMHLMSEEDLTRTAARLGLTVEDQKDYRIINRKNADGTTSKVVGVNEMVRHNSEVYGNIEQLTNHLKREEGRFLQQLLENGCSYQVISGLDMLDWYTSKDIYSKANPRNPVIRTILNRFGNDAAGRIDYMQNWVDETTGKLILAKQGSKNIISLSDRFDINKNATLNPLLERFFYVESLTSNNLRFSLTGSELNHAPRKNSPFDVAKKARTYEEWNNLGYGTLTDIEFNILHNAEGTGVLDSSLDIDDLSRKVANLEILNAPKTLISAINNLLDTSYEFIANTSQGTQLKRNVIIPATLQYCLQNTKEGIPPQIKCAVLHDTEAPVWNYRGDHEGSIDACDGSAIITPFQCILENRALGTQKVGFTKKPIWHHYDTSTGTTFLAKFATNTATNEAMNTSGLSTINLHNLFKKMTNLQWDPADNIDLTKGLTAATSFGGYEDATDMEGITNNMSHKAWFTGTILNNKRLCYKTSLGDLIEITDLNKTVSRVEGNVPIYYTTEKLAGTVMKPVRKYHIFYDEALDNGSIDKSRHITYATYQQAIKGLADLNSQGKNAHTINSLYELHTALGGIACTDSNGVASEYNNEIVVNYMNNIGNRTAPGRGPIYVSQTTFNQPLKKYHIGYALNKTAAKNGVKNINPATSWSDNSDLMYFDVDSDGLGMQMNADHDITDSELTEFSQVIAATAAYGYTYDQCNELFQSLARTAFQASEKTLTAVDNFLDQMNAGDRNAASSLLYDTIGRIIFVNQNIKDTENLTNIILEGVQKIFNKYQDHTNDVVKIPFSDGNIYSDFIATLASTITRDSIKRQHPGSGCVMVGGYNMVQYFEVPRADGTVEKLFTDSIIGRARDEYKAELTQYLIEHGDEFNSVQNAVTIKGNTYYLNGMSLSMMEDVALSIDNTGAFSNYYTNVKDIAAHNRYLMQTYLAKRQSDLDAVPVYSDRSYFMPSDIVDVLDNQGNLVETVDLNSLEIYYNFKNGLSKSGQAYAPDYAYRSSIMAPHNLRPSTIRWQYIDDQGVTRYMNYFDLPHVRQAFMEGGINTPEYRAQVQQALQDIHDGKFIDATGHQYNIIEGTLENEAAELVMSNLYKDLFDIGDESLVDILAQGESYFQNKSRVYSTPSEDVYDLAFLRDNGKHVLITFNPVTDDGYIESNPFSNNTATNNQDEIVLMRKGRELFEIGRWADVDDVVYDSKTNKYISKNGSAINENDYRVKDGKVQQRFDYVKRYNYTTKKDNRHGNVVYTKNTLYQIADVDVFKKAMAGKPDMSDENAEAQRASIIRKIYMSGDFKMAEIKPDHITNAVSEAKVQKITSALNSGRKSLLGSVHISEAVKNLLNAQISHRGTNYHDATGFISKLKSQLFAEEAHKKWVSFQDSLKFISARIPAQTLQSFMAMKLVGWTGNNTNMAYVSHFQTYLQGSDYDIDKAYIMGQNYDANSTYVKWSPYFDYTSLKTLEASKELPIPKNAVISESEQGVDITEEMRTLIANSDYSQSGKTLHTNQKTETGANKRSETEKVRFLRALGQLLRKVENADGLYKCDPNVAGKELIERMILQHEAYQIPASIAEEAFKNSASANIYAVSHDIRNRDQAYTAVSMSLMRASAEHSPKGEQAASLSMLNPLTKYVMQYQNMVGKNVIGITANGEKFWFNNYYYWNKTLNNSKAENAEDCKYLRFSTTLSRVQGRSRGTMFDPAQSTVTINHIPDLDLRNEQIRNVLNKMGIGAEGEQYKYVDQLISQLLSAATDNAKELILAKINANTDFAKMYLHLMMLGYDVNDIAAFMTTPVAEFIISRSSENMFQADSAYQTAYRAADLALGRISSKAFLHGYQSYLDEETQELHTIKKDILVRDALVDLISQHEDLEAAIYKALDIDPELGDLRIKLNDLMSAFLQEAVINPSNLFDSETNKIDLIREFGGIQDAEINSYLRYCQDIYLQMRNMVDQYRTLMIQANRAQGNNSHVTTRDALNYMLADINDFRKIFNLASETSNIAVGFLGLNQGLPTDKLSMIKKINQMKRVVTDREMVLRIGANTLFDTTTKQLNDEAFAELYERIVDNNQYITEDEARDALIAAYNADIVNNFDPVQMLTDENYRQIATDYLHIIKGTANAIDMVYSIPHYKQIMDCMKALVVSDRTLSAKSRLINELTSKNENIGSLTDQQLRGIIRYVDTVTILDFLESTDVPEIVLDKTVDGFNKLFDNVRVNSFDLGTMEGICGFKRFMETDFYDYLQNNFRDKNPLVKHLIRSTIGEQTLLTTSIDLMNPNITTTSQLAYQDILKGTSMFENERFGSNPLSITDMLQLYNIIVNYNQYGSDRLTTAFKACTGKDNMLQKFLNFESKRDYDSSAVADYNDLDFQISSAPIVSNYAMRFHSEPFVKVKDPVWNYVLMKYNQSSNSYTQYPLLPSITNRNEAPEIQDVRLTNYLENCPFEVPMRMKMRDLAQSIEFEGPVTDEIRNTIKAALTDLTMSNKILTLKFC